MYRAVGTNGCCGDISQEVHCWSVPCGIEPILDLNVERGIHLDKSDLTTAVGYDWFSCPDHVHMAKWAILGKSDAENSVQSDRL